VFGESPENPHHRRPDSTMQRWCSMDIETLLVSLYVLVDDWREATRNRTARQPGRPVLLSDPEVLTLVILA